MNQQDLARLETKVAEIVGPMNDLFRELERPLREIVSARRMAPSEARAEGAPPVTWDLHELGRFARVVVGEQRDLVALLQASSNVLTEGMRACASPARCALASICSRFTWKSSLPLALGKGFT
jgi:hypothetical protein